MTEWTLREKLIGDYKAEIREGEKWKAEGKTSVSANVAPEAIRKGRTEVPIDEYIQYWKDGLEALQKGGSLEKYNY